MRPRPPIAYLALTLISSSSLALGACSEASEGGPSPDTSAPLDTTGAADASDADDSAEVDVESDTSLALDAAPDVSDEVPAGEYCERSADLFCPYYLRCGRIVADDLGDCRATFLESCNARYEPLYRDLEARGALALSAAGLARCGAHLEAVACEDQIFDLDGCPDVWLGQVPDAGACGPGIESFVCGEQSTCLIDLSFCGRCVPLTTGACDLEHRCPDTAVCREGACVSRLAVGEPCDDSLPCVLGAYCEGTCKAPAIVAVGERCDQVRRCPYKAQCVSGRCVEYALVGEPCRGEVGCASGHCDGGTCAALLAAGAPCTVGAACESGRCEDLRCAPIAWSCRE